MNDATSNIRDSVERAQALLRAEDGAGALRLCREALAEHGENPRLLALLARITAGTGRHDEALGFAWRAVAADDACAECHDTLGHLQLLAGRHADAIISLTRAVDLDPRSATARNHLGMAYAAARCPAAAQDAFHAAVELCPDYAEVQRHLAALTHAEGRPDETAQALHRVIEIEPADMGCRRQLAALLVEQGRPDEAAVVLEEALACSPEDPETGRVLAGVWLGLGRLDEALRLSERVVEGHPHNADAQFGLGNVWLRLGRPGDALACYRRAVAIQPQSARARFALASPLLMLGRYREGWEAYEARLDMPDISWKVQACRDRLWDGGPLNARHLLVHAEQGFGDTLQFVRYLPELRARIGPDARVDLLCEPKLARVLGTVRGIDNVLAPEVIGHMNFDLQVPLLSLPHRLGTTLDTIPAQVPYIGLPEGTTSRVERPPGSRLAVAFSWAGRPTHADNRMRSLPLPELAPLFELQDVLFVNGQVGAPRAELAPYLERANVIDAAGDFAETLAVFDQVDLLITVDTSMAHLAGAYGKPVWTLLSFGGEWRWLTEREDTPWYPTMRLFRQHRPGDWAQVIERVRDALRARLDAAQGGTPVADGP